MHDPSRCASLLALGAPVFALASIGAGLHEKTLSVLLNLLDDDLDIKSAIDAPSLLMPSFETDGLPRPQVSAGAFAPSLLAGVRDLGLDPKVVAPADFSPWGWIVGVRIDPERKERTAAAPKTFNGAALGQ